MNQPSNISEAARRAAREIDLLVANTSGLGTCAAARQNFAAIIQAALDSTHPAPKEGEDRIGGFRITPDGFKMNSPTPPTKEETAAYLAHEKSDLLASIAALELRLSEKTREVEALKKSANFHRDLGITLLDAKWLDPECHKGCQSLVFRTRLQQAEELLREAQNALSLQATGRDRVMTETRIAAFLNSKTP